MSVMLGVHWAYAWQAVRNCFLPEWRGDSGRSVRQSGQTESTSECGPAGEYFRGSQAIAYVIRLVTVCPARSLLGLVVRTEGDVRFRRSEVNATRDVFGQIIQRRVLPSQRAKIDLIRLMEAVARRHRWERIPLAPGRRDRTSLPNVLLRAPAATARFCPIRQLACHRVLRLRITISLCCAFHTRLPLNLTLFPLARSLLLALQYAGRTATERCGRECECWENDMKLRIRSNSVRVRLDQKDLAELLEHSRVLDALRVGPGSNHTFTYAVVIGSAPPGRPEVHYSSGLLVLTIDHGDAEEWAAGARVGFDHEQRVESGSVRVILEKDFACLDRPAEDAAEDAWAFPNPSVVCK